MAKNFKYIVGVGSRLGNFQTACDVIGMTEIPFVSQGADLISCGISLATGDYVGAALSVGGLIPGVGQATGAAKIARNSIKIAGKVQEVAKTTKTTAKAGDFLSLTSKSRNVDLSKAKSATGTTQKSVVNAKAQPKQPAKEKENTVKNTVQQTIDKVNKEIEDIKKATAEVERKLDIGGAPNAFKGALEKSLKEGTKKVVQSNNAKYIKQFIKNVENAKQYGYRNIIGKKSIF